MRLRLRFLLTLLLAMLRPRIAVLDASSLLSIRFRRAARLFQKIELRTRILCWTEEAAWFEQEFLADGRSICLAHCKAKMRTKRGPIDRRVARAVGTHRHPVSRRPARRDAAGDARSESQAGPAREVAVSGAR